MNTSIMELKESAANMSMHGFGRVFISKSKKMKFIWLLIMLFNVLSFNIALVTLFKQFFRRDYTTKRETVIESKIQFPGITICGNAISKYKFARFLKMSNKTLEADVSLHADQFLRMEGTLQKLGTVENLHKVSPDSENLFINSIPGTCSFGYTTECKFRKVIVPYKGVCYKFNMDGRYFQKQSGYLNGLSLILFLNTSDSLSLSDNTGDSVQLSVMQFNETVFMSSDFIFASVGQLTKVEISKTEIKRLKSPFSSNCTDGESVSLWGNGTYTLENCQTTCLAKIVYEKCNGLDFYHRMLFNVENKAGENASEIFNCMFNIYGLLIKTNFEPCHCQLPCTETKFHKVLSSSKWPPKNELPMYRALVSKELGLNYSEVTEEFIRDNLVRLNVYFGDMTYERLSEIEEFTAVKLISDIGGQMGIWIGASVFSLAEVLFLFGQLVISLIENRAKGKSRGISIKTPPVSIQ